MLDSIVVNNKSLSIHNNYKFKPSQNTISFFYKAKITRFFLILYFFLKLILYLWIITKISHSIPTESKIKSTFLNILS